MEIVIETERLILRKFTLDDAAFMLELLNTPAWLRFIGDRGVRKQYLLNGNIKSYQEYGFGFYVVVVKETNESIGICGIKKREELDDIDVGFGFFPQFVGKGYGYEAASATLYYSINVLKIKRIVAIVDPENAASISLIKKIGLQFEKMTHLSDNKIELMLFGY